MYGDMKRQHIHLQKGLQTKTNQNKKINRRTQSKRKDKIHPTSLPMEVLIKNHNENKGRL